MKPGTIDPKLRAIQVTAVIVVFGIGFWQFARADFDWRVVLEMTSPWTFFLAMASLPVFGFPISACYIYAGIAFPPIQAIPICIAALSINMSVSYALTHSMFRGPIMRFIESRQWNLPTLTDQNQFRLIFLVRTVPGPPFFFQNLTLGLAGIPFWTYLWVSLVAQGGIAIAVILCARYLSKDPWSAGGLILIGALTALFLARAIQHLRKKRRSDKNSSF